jgi:hypothetical protein
MLVAFRMKRASRAGVCRTGGAAIFARWRYLPLRRGRAKPAALLAGLAVCASCAAWFVRDAKRHLASQGVYSGGKRPFGSDVVMDGEVRRIVPNAAEMAVVERMKAMRRDGATYRAIGAVTGHGPKSVQRILERVN